LSKKKGPGFRSLVGRSSSKRQSVFRTLVESGQATVGRGTYGEPTVYSWETSTKLRIGAYCSIAAEVHILLGGEHRLDWVTTNPIRVLKNLPGAWEDGHPASKGDVVIGNDVWLAHRTTILSGVTIGDGAVVGSASVVTRDVPPFAIVSGNPADVMRYRFPEETREALARIAWWNWPEDKVLASVDLLCSGDVEGFIERFDR
jgi:acetyltransferase-like isoleucine patch superfamily enzyme